MPGRSLHELVAIADRDADAARQVVKLAARRDEFARLRYGAWCLIEHHGAPLRLFVDDAPARLWPEGGWREEAAAEGRFVTATDASRTLHLTAGKRVPLLWDRARQAHFLADCVERDLGRFEAWSEHALIEPHPRTLIEDLRAHLRGQLEAEELEDLWLEWRDDALDYIAGEDAVAAEVWWAAWGGLRVWTGPEEEAAEMMRETLAALHRSTPPGAVTATLAWQRQRLLAYLLDRVHLPSGRPARRP